MEILPDHLLFQIADYLSIDELPSLNLTSILLYNRLCQNPDFLRLRFATLIELENLSNFELVWDIILSRIQEREKISNLLLNFWRTSDVDFYIRQNPLTRFRQLDYIIYLNSSQNNEVCSLMNTKRIAELAFQALNFLQKNQPISSLLLTVTNYYLRKPPYQFPRIELIGLILFARHRNFEISIESSLEIFIE